MTQDGSSFTYTFDDEGHLTIASGMTNGPYCYVYDGNGLRVAKKSNSNSTCSTGTVQKLYWRSLAGDALAETDGNGNTLNEYVFFAGRRVASRNSSGSVFYWFADQLGSTRTITDANGNLCYDAEFTPYGQEISHTERLQTTACPPSYKFTGYERDPETTVGANDTGLDYAFARYYSSRLGRFLSTDPLGGAIGDLQSHNAYAYVANNPLNLTDPSGLCGRNPNNARVTTACPDGDAPYPCAYAGNGCAGGGPGCSLDGCGDGLGGPGCYLNGMSVGCNILGGLLSNPGGYTVRCPPGGCPIGSQVVDGPNGTISWQQWAPINQATSFIGGAAVSSTVYWGWKTISTASDSGDNSSWWGTFVSTFFSGLVSSEGWKAVYHSTVDAGGCDRLMFETFADVLNPLPSNDAGARDLAEWAPKAAAGAGQVAASAYSVYRGLSSPLSSSIYRGLQSSTLGYAGALEEAAPYALVGYATGKAVYTAGSAAYNGNCH